MTFVAAPNCVSLAVIWTLDNQPGETTYHYRLAAPADATALTAIIHVAFARYTTDNGLFANTWEIVKAYARALDTATSPSVELNPAAPIQGAHTSGALPNNVSFAVTRYTGLAGRKMRGRVYWPGIPPDRLDGSSSIGSGTALAYVGFCEAMLADQLAGAAAAHEIILHRATGTHDDVIAYRYSDLFIDSQRRRLPGHNIHH